MKKILLFILLTVPFLSYAQKIKQKTFNNTRDAMIVHLGNNYLSRNEKNYGKIPYFTVSNWTIKGEYQKQTSLIDFDIKSIPKNAIIKNATLTLYKYPDHEFSNGTYPQLKISVITEDWDENTVTWNNKPNISSTKTLIITDDNFSKIDVTELIKDKLDNPDKNKGLYIEPKGNDVYQGIIFSSREYKNPSLHPKLTVEYFVPDKNSPFKIYTLLIYNSDLQLVKSKKIYDMQMYLDEINDLKGDKFLCIIIQNDKILSSIVIDKTQ